MLLFYYMLPCLLFSNIMILVIPIPNEASAFLWHILLPVHVIVCYAAYVGWTVLGLATMQPYSNKASLPLTHFIF